MGTVEAILSIEKKNFKLLSIMNYSPSQTFKTHHK